MRNKFCDVGRHTVNALWHARRVNKDTGDIIRPSCCKSCLSRKPIGHSKPKEEKKEINIFFANQSLLMPNNCENCNAPLDKSTFFARRAQTCHILPKNRFKTVATHPSNKMFMCCFDGCYAHGDWDNQDAEKRKNMPVYKLAIKRYREIEHLLSDADKIQAEIYLGLKKNNMSMYNMINGVNKATFFILPMLGDKHPDNYPRFRDCFIGEDNTIHVYTRVGGGNRDCGFGEKELQDHPNYLYDQDDDFDTTYATYVFSVPDEWKKDYDLILGGRIKEISQNYKDRLYSVYPKLKDTFDNLFE